MELCAAYPAPAGTQADPAAILVVTMHEGKVIAINATALPDSLPILMAATSEWGVVDSAGFGTQSADTPASPVRMRIRLSNGVTAILPSPYLPVCATS